MNPIDKLTFVSNKNHYVYEHSFFEILIQKNFDYKTECFFNEEILYQKYFENQKLTFDFIDKTFWYLNSTLDVNIKLLYIKTIAKNVDINSYSYFIYKLKNKDFTLNTFPFVFKSFNRYSSLTNEDIYKEFMKYIFINSSAELLNNILKDYNYNNNTLYNLFRLINNKTYNQLSPLVIVNILISYNQNEDWFKKIENEQIFDYIIENKLFWHIFLNYKEDLPLFFKYLFSKIEQTIIKNNNYNYTLTNEFTLLSFIFNNNIHIRMYIKECLLYYFPITNIKTLYQNINKDNNIIARYVIYEYNQQSFIYNLKVFFKLINKTKLTIDYLTT
jgi:hypothetical protein